MSDYDVGKAFARIEREIIASMMRNMDHHRTEEDKEGKKWPQWQTMQLKSLEKFKRDNRKKYDFTKINSTIDGLIQEAYDKGGMEEEIRILKQIKRLHGNSVTNVVKAKISDIKQRLTPGVNQEFFGLNREKVDKLIKATHSDMEKVEQAMLRRADDQYRKIIFNAQMADISGAFTYEQAVDMAAKDFLNAGLNCVEYKNGRRVTAKTYAEMAIRTANARATLMAEGDKRQQLGITTVIVGHNGSACPLCQKWLGKVLIDDVYSGGKPTDGEYPLLSIAMKEGLFHPNCRDVIGTYIPGITRLPEPPKPEERQLSFDVYNLEQKEKQAKHNAERMGRLGDNSLDPSNKKKYKHREKMWKEKVEEYEDEKRKLLAEVETESELGKFKAKIENDEGMKKEYYKMLKNKFSHGKKDAKRVFNKYVPNDSVSDCKYEGTAEYKDGKIKMHYGADMNNNRGAGATWFHEHGHMVDELAGDISSSKAFIEALNDDFIDNTLRKSYNQIEEELKDMRSQSAVSDIFNGISKDKIKGVAYHPLRNNGSSYWTEETIRQEAFAHMFECQFDELRYREMKKYFPKSLHVFEQLLKEV